jgi:hypothetical protein
MPVNRSLEEEKYEVTDTFGDDFDVNARPEAKESSAVRSGWDAAEKLTPASGDYPVDFKHSEQPQIIKFLDPSGPFAAYKQHFLSNKDGKKSYVCLEGNCPLCTILKHRPEDKRAFTVANLSTDPVSRQILTATPRLFTTLSTTNSGPFGPLNEKDVYWSLSRSGIKQTTTYQLQQLTGAALSKFSVDVKVAEAAIATMEPYPNSTIRENSYAELLEIAQDLS